MRSSGSDTPYHRRRTYVILVVTLLVISLILILISKTQTEAFSKPRSVIETVTAPVAEVISLPIVKTQNIFSNLAERSRAFEENKSLKAENARLRDVEIKNKALQTQINRLEEILKTDIVSDIPVDKIPARAVVETKGPFVRSALLNVGRFHGVSQGHAVMTTDGLYGHVLRASGRSSRVLLLNDLNSRIAVMSGRNGDRAILMGNNRERPLLSFVGPNTDWIEGDVVVTSGDEGILPAGLPIGEVVQDDGNTLFVKLYASNSPIDWVWVYPFTPIEEPDFENFSEDQRVQEQLEVQNN